MADVHVFLIEQEITVITLFFPYVHAYMQAENIYNDEDPDTPAAELEQAST